MKFLCILLPLVGQIAFDARAADKACNPQVILESRKISHTFAIPGFDEFIITDPPEIKKYLIATTNTSTTASNSWTDEYVPASTPGNPPLYSEAGTATGSETWSEENLKTIVTVDRLTAAETYQHSGTRTWEENNDLKQVQEEYSNDPMCYHRWTNDVYSINQTWSYSTVNNVCRESTTSTVTGTRSYSYHCDNKSTVTYTNVVNNTMSVAGTSVCQGTVVTNSSTSMKITGVTAAGSGETTVNLSRYYPFHEFVEDRKNLFKENYYYSGAFAPGRVAAHNYPTGDEKQGVDLGKIQYRFRLQGTEKEKPYRLVWTEVIKSNGTNVVGQRVREAYVLGAGPETVTDLFETLPGDLHEEILVGTAVAAPVISCSIGCIPGPQRIKLGPLAGFEQAPGSASFENEGVLMRLSLGRAKFGEPAGSLLLSEIKPDPQLRKRILLRVTGNGAGVSIQSDTNGIFRINAPQAVVKVSTINDYSYAIKFYSPIVDPDTGIPYKTFVVDTQTASNESPASAVSEVTITEQSEAGSAEFLYEHSPGTRGWTLTLPTGGVNKFDNYYSHNNNINYRTMVRTVSENGITNTTTSIYRLWFGPTGAEGLIQRTEGTGAEARTTTYDHYADPHFQDGNAALALYDVNYPDGSWARFGYHGISGAAGTTYLPLNNEGPNEAQKMITYDYSPHGSGDNGMASPWEPRTILTWVNGWKVAEQFNIVTAQMRKEIVSLSPTGFYPPSEALTTTYLFDAGGKLTSFESPDGTMEIYSETVYTTNKTEVSQSGKPNPTKSAIEDGIQTVKQLDNLGYPMTVVATDIGTGIEISRLTFSNHDEFGRPRKVTFKDGSFIEATYDDCCGAATVLTRDKILYTFLTDEVGRPVQFDGLGVTNHVTFAPNGQIYTRAREAGAQFHVLGTNLFNSAGLLTNSSNPLGGSSTFGEYFDSQGRYVRSETDDVTGGTMLQTFNKSGTLAEVSGTRATPMRFVYDTEASGPDAGAEFKLEIRLGTGATDTNEWTKSFMDAAGRVYKVVYSGPDAQNYPTAYFFYNSQGQLEKEVDPDGVTRLYTYNGRGEREKTVLDANRNGLIDSAGADEISMVTRAYATNSFNVAARVEQEYVWDVLNSNSSRLVSSVEHAVDGTRSWRIARNAGTNVVRALGRSIPDSGGNAFETNTAPDGSYVVFQYQYGKLLSGTLRGAGAGNPQLEKFTFDYDMFNRRYQVIDSRNGPTTYSYNSADMVTNILSTVPYPGQPPQRTAYFYDNMGNLLYQLLPDNTWVTNVFTLRGELERTSGSRTYRAEYGYDPQGRLATLKTWTNYPGSSVAATTSWGYDPYSGLLASKSYEGGKTNGYIFSPGGRLYERIWHRKDGSGNNIKTTYTNNLAGHLGQVIYSDSTPGITLTYDRLGRQNTLLHDGTTLTYGYNDVGQILTEAYTGTGILAGRTVTRSYDALLRRSSLALTGYSLTSTAYGYDNARASRLTNVLNGIYSTAYEYVPNSSLVWKTTSRENNDVRLTVVRDYDQLNRLRQIDSIPGAFGINPLGTRYDYNLANQRTKGHLADGSAWEYGYDSLGQVTSGKRKWEDGTFVAGQQFEYEFDGIGNRKVAKNGGVESGSSSGLRSFAYHPNGLNQYSSRSVPGSFDVIGIASPAATVTVNGGTAYEKGEYFQRSVSVSNANTPLYSTVSVSATEGGVSSGPTGGKVFVPGTPESFSYDDDGNLKQDGRWDYTWNAENRLTKMESRSGAPAGSKRRLEFKYDAYGRRIWKKETNLDTSAVISERKYIYDGWNLLAELNASNGLEQHYVWGTDLSGTLQGAGGVGGLLAVRPSSTSVAHFVGYDGGGNVTGLVGGSSGLWSAQYEYGPFGEAIRETGPMAEANPFRWSTKFTDETSGLVYYGYRYYNPSTGRWVNRDSIEENGGLNLYASFLNRPSSIIDPLGADAWSNLYEGENYVARVSIPLNVLPPELTNPIPLDNPFERDTEALEVVIWMLIPNPKETYKTADQQMAKAFSGGLPWEDRVGAGLNSISTTILGTVELVPGGNAVAKGVCACEGIIYKTIKRTRKSNRVVFEGMEVRAVRDLSHVDDSTLKAMAKDGFAPSSINGEKIVLHHHKQSSNGPIIEMPRSHNKNPHPNPNVHPEGNAKGAGLSEAEREAFNSWREEYWKARAREELKRRCSI